MSRKEFIEGSGYEMPPNFLIGISLNGIAIFALIVYMFFHIISKFLFIFIFLPSVISPILIFLFWKYRINLNSITLDKLEQKKAIEGGLGYTTAGAIVFWSITIAMGVSLYFLRNQSDVGSIVLINIPSISFTLSSLPQFK